MNGREDLYDMGITIAVSSQERRGCEWGGFGILFFSFRMSDHACLHQVRNLCCKPWGQLIIMINVTIVMITLF